MDDRVPAPAGEPEVPAEIDEPEVPAAIDEPEAAPPARGFPGFPAGDPAQLPLSQRPRGLDAVPAPGGRDPEIRRTVARERPYVRLLVGMVAVIVGGSLLLTFLALLSAAFLR
jgi:hypothetical protein